MAETPVPLVLQFSTSETMPGFYVDVTTEPVAQLMYRTGDGHSTYLCRCHPDGWFDFPTIGDGWPFRLGGNHSAVGIEVPH